MWTEISPPPFEHLRDDGLAITQGMTIDPCNPAKVYVCVPHTSSTCTDAACRGLFRSDDAGTTWTELGDFQDCKNIRVDPGDPLHLYQVGATDFGFHVSSDGGETWTVPPGWMEAAGEVSAFDLYHVDVDPADFAHLLVSTHSGFAGVLESFDGGETWEARPEVDAGVGAGNGVFFLYEPTLGIGDAQTWLFGTQGGGYWRTTDAGNQWTKVSDVNMTHGGATVHYTREGVLYVSGDAGTILRSDDNGETFTHLQPTGNGSAQFLSIIGDGERLFTGSHGGGPFLTAPETDDSAWSPFNDQLFDEGPFQMAIDPHNHILYSANIRGGVWALALE